MNKLLLLTGTLLFILLTACSPSQSSGTAAQPGGFNDNIANALPTEAQLALGTLLLDSTNLAVDKTQAYQLLPLWQTASNLADGNQVEAAEMSTVTGRIKDTLSTEQIAAISAMQLSQSTVGEMIQAGTLAIPAGEPGGYDRNFAGGLVDSQLANIDPALLESSQVQQAVSGEALNNALSAALTKQVIYLLETKMG